MAFGCIARSLLVLVGLQSCVHFVCSEFREDQEHEDVINGELETCINIRCSDHPPRTCKDVYTPHSRETVILADGYLVSCDTQTDGGGWIVIQRRKDKDVDFYRNWVDYKYGFGNVSGNFWFGNEHIHRMTVLRPHELRIDFTFNGTEYYARYSHFRLFGETEKYQLDIGGFSGNAGDSLAYHNGMAFSTFDRDNDIVTANIAFVYQGAWWYSNGHTSNLNGLWGSTVYGQSLTWVTTTDNVNSATSTEIKIRPIV